jgi:uncharacterized membrane protein YeiH
MPPELVQRAVAGLDLDRQVWIHGSAMIWRYFDLGASFIWAISGALVAARRGYDLTGICAIALVSSTGGGLLRDGLFLQQGPPALVLTPMYIIIAAVAALLVWSLGQQARPLRVFARFAGVVDAVGLGSFAVVGMQVALHARLSIPGVVLVGVVNAVGGSVLRSLLLHEIPEVFRPGELTAVAALFGCLIHLGLTLVLGVDPRPSAVITIVLVALLRASSVHYGLRTHAARGFTAPPPPEAPPPDDTHLALTGRGDARVKPEDR